ncbi:hypothetical protein [Pseudomonas sp. LB3P14]
MLAPTPRCPTHILNGLKKKLLKIQFNQVTKCTTLGSIFFCALLILTLGPSFQQHGLALLTSPSSSLYQSVYKDALIRFPSFKEWILGNDYLLYSIGAAALTLCIYKSRSMRGAIILTSVTSFAFMTLLDLGSFIWYETFTGSQLFESVSSNIIGAPLTSALLVVILWSAERLKKSMAEHVKLAEFVSSLLPAILGLLVFLFQYYALTLVFNPTPSNIEAKTSPKSGASYIFSQEMKERHQKKNAAECNCEPEKNNKNDFGFLKGQFEGNLTFQGNAENATLGWKATNSDDFEITVTAFDGCLTEDLLKANTDKSKALKITDLRDLSIILDKGIVILGSKTDDGNIEVRQSKVEPSWHLKDDKGHELNRFVMATDVTEYWSNEVPKKFIIQLPLFTMNEASEVTSAEKIIKLDMNGKIYSLAFKPNAPRATSNVCAPFNLSGPPLSLSTHFSKAGAIKIILEIRQTEKSKVYSFSKQNSFSLTGLNGWLSVSNIKPERIKNLISPGIMQGLTIGGNINYLRLNGESIKNILGHEFAFYSGSISGRADDDGSLIYQGVADWVWVDGKRLSKTRWESLDGATQGILLTLAGLLILAFGRIIFICMRDNDSYHL